MYIFSSYILSMVAFWLYLKSLWSFLFKIIMILIITYVIKSASFVLLWVSFRFCFFVSTLCVYILYMIWYMYISLLQYIFAVSGRDKPMCSSSHGLCNGCVWSSVIHNSFALYGGVSFKLVVLERLNVSETKNWVTLSCKRGINFPFFWAENEFNNLEFLLNHIIHSFLLVV